MPRPLYAVVHSSALSHNLERARQAAPNSQLWAVIKANAYGHGLLRAAAALAAADGFAILNIEDALRLRAWGWTKPILLLEGVFQPAEYGLCAEHGLTPVVHARHQLQWLRAVDPATPLPIYLKLNSGMNRLGFAAREFVAALDEARRLNSVRSLTLMEHFADADVAGGTEAPLRLMNELAPPEFPRSLANSAAILSAPETHGDWVRPGIMLYGATPFADRSAADLGLRPAMSLESELIAVQQLAAGERVGYGGTFQAERPMRIGVVACGYADGYPRHAPTGTPIVVGGVNTRVVGRVSMDMLTVDLSAVPDADVGTAVELWGRRLPVDEVAQACGTVGYELLSALAPRVAVRED